MLPNRARNASVGPGLSGRTVRTGPPAVGGARMDGLTFTVGGEVGGTFTAVWVAASDGRVASARVPSGADPGADVVEAARRTADAFELTHGALLGAVERVALAVDLALPAIEQGTLART